jgi:hypothetical protein
MEKLMKIFKLTILLIFLLSSTLSHAGNEGGGGDAVICENGTAALLDLIEPIEHSYLDPSSSTGSEILFKDRSLVLIEDHKNVYTDYSIPKIYETIYIADNLLDGDRSPGRGFSSSAYYIGETLGFGHLDFKWSISAPAPLIWILTDEPLEHLKDEGKR